MKTYLKATTRTLGTHIIKILIIAAIIAVGVGLSSGLGAIPSLVNHSFNDYMSDVNYPDFIIKATQPTGITPEMVETIESLDFAKQTSTLTELDSEDGMRTYYIDFENYQLNKLELITGRMPESSTEILVEQKTTYIASYAIGDSITYQSQSFEVVGIVKNPMLLYQNEIPLNGYDKNINTVIYFDQSFIVKTDLYLKTIITLDRFSADYKEQIASYKNTLESLYPDDYVVLSYDEMITYVVVDENIDKMNVLSFIFPIFFTFVVVIVASSTMTRIIEDDRLIIGSLLSLGFSKHKIKMRYYLIALISGVAGSAVGILTGFNILARLVYQAFDSLIKMPAMSTIWSIESGVITGLLFIVLMILTIEVILFRLFKEKPADLLRYKSPKPGAKIFLEYIPFVWNRLKFKYKSSLRNIFRNPLHFMMTWISIAGSTILVIAGFGLLDNVSAGADNTSDSIELIALIVLIAAAALSILVTYNLTNMSIEERKREIATLKVLGYNRFEISGYIYREILLMSLFGILCGLPLGYYALSFIFDYIDFGTVEHVQLISWFYTVILSILFILITDVLLYPKIQHIDMNSALKTID